MPLFDREPQGAGQLTTEITPYLTMAIELEADQRMSNFELDLAIAGRDLLTSNDHFQAASAYLSLARNRATVATELYGQLSAQTPQEAKRNRAGNDAARGFLVQEFQTAQHNLETADRVSAERRLLEPPLTHELEAQRSQSRWPARAQVPRSFVHGTITGMDNLYGVVNSQFAKTLASQTLPNDFRLRLRQHVQPLFSQVENCRTSIDRLSGGMPTSLVADGALDDAYSRAREAAGLLDTITLWLTVPRMFDEAFTLRHPYDETRPPEKKFNPGALGPIATRASLPAPQPARPQRAFDPDILAAPSTPSNPATPASTPFVPKPFDPTDLGGTPPSAPSQPEKPAGRAFNPDDLGQKTPPKPSQPQPPQRRPFSPDDLESDDK